MIDLNPTETLTQDKAEILKFLRREAKKDPVFADAVMTTHKTLEDVVSYVKEQAHKEAQNGCAIISESVVFGWSAEFIIDELQTDESSKAKTAEESLAEFYAESELFRGL